MFCCHEERAEVDSDGDDMELLTINMRSRWRSWRGTRQGWHAKTEIWSWEWPQSTNAGQTKADKVGDGRADIDEINHMAYGIWTRATTAPWGDGTEGSDSVGTWQVPQSTVNKDNQPCYNEETNIWTMIQAAKTNNDNLVHDNQQCINYCSTKGKGDEGDSHSTTTTRQQ